MGIQHSPTNISNKQSKSTSAPACHIIHLIIWSLSTLSQISLYLLLQSQYKHPVFCECPRNVELVCIKLPCAGRQTPNSRGALDLYFSLSCDFLLSTVSKSGYLYLDIFL